MFIHCKSLLLTISKNKFESDSLVNSIDDLLELSDNSFEIQDHIPSSLTPEAWFWGHCSNLQVWYEGNYNTQLLDSNLAFPLLKKLTEAGDTRAKQVFKDEIAKRFEKGNLNSIIYLLENDYLSYLNKEEIECLLDQTAFNLTTNIVIELQSIWSEILESKYWKLAEIIDILLFFALKYDIKYIFHIIEALPEKLKEDFVKKIILHLNYKEFRHYKIPYGWYFSFFEKLLNYIHINYPKIFNDLNLIDSGYLNGALSLDEKFAIGTIFSRSSNNSLSLY
ncbi:MAG: hypothetical protein ACFFHV_04305 [Promethearchaeota archaeon]